MYKRQDLVHKNIAIFQSIIPEITKRDFEGILLIVANPVDILTYTAQKPVSYTHLDVYKRQTLGWPEKTEDLDYFYPNDVLVTGYDS